MSDTDDKRKDDSDKMVFRGYDGKVNFAEFDKHVARQLRAKYGTTLGDQFWTNTLPIVQGEGAMGNDDFLAHCEDILYAMADRNPARYKHLYDMDSGFWQRGWHVTWRKSEFERMYDTVSSKCKGEALLCIEENGMKSAPNIRSILKHEFGGAGEDIKLREKMFDLCMPKTESATAFPKGIDISKKFRALNVERMELGELCPKEDRETYLYAKESYMVKNILKLLRGSEYDKPIKDLLMEIKFDRKLKRAALNEGGVDEEDIDLEDWDYRNFKDGWIPTFKRLRRKLVNYYKDQKFNKQSEEGPKAKLPSMLVKDMIEKHVASLIAPGLGQRPNTSGSVFPQDGRSNPTCWACGLKGHKRGDAECQMKNDRSGGNNSFASKRKFEQSSSRQAPGQANKQGKEICQFYKETGKCKFGAKCRRLHVDSGGAERRPKRKPDRSVAFNLTKAQKKRNKSALKVQIKQSSKVDGDPESELDTIIRGFCMISIRTIPRELSRSKEISLSMLNMKLHQNETFVYDTGSAEGISTCKSDFYRLDTSEVAKESAIIKGPSVGAPICGGRGSLIFLFDIKGIQMGLVHPNGIYATAEDADLEFRLASALELKRHGIKMIGGAFEEPDTIHCVRTHVSFETISEGNLMLVKTKGKASDLKPSKKFEAYLDKVKKGLVSPIFKLSSYDGSNPTPVVRRGANMKEDHPLQIFLCSSKTKEFVSINLMNEAKLSQIELSRLYCRRFAFCDTNMFRVMAKKESFGNFPNLPVLNEDNRFGDMAKYKRLPYKKNDPENTMQAPPWWNVSCDGYGGLNSLGPESYEGAIGAYLFVCTSTGSTDLRLYASHSQFPIALHQFLVRVQAEYWTVRTLYVDTHSVNISADVEEVLALFQVKLMPVSAGSPQEMAFAESKVRVIKRMSTAMLLGAPHLPQNMWACSDQYSNFLGDFLPIQTRQNECSFYMRTGKMVDWALLKIKCFGAPCIFAPIDGPIHKRAPIMEEGWFVGRQWPFMIIKRKSDGKLLNVSDKKVRVYESMYTIPLLEDYDPTVFPEIVQDVKDIVNNEAAPRPEVDNNMVASIKSLREHKLQLPGRHARDMTKLEESAMYGNGHQTVEGIHLDQVVNSNVDQLAQIIAEHSRKGSSLKESILEAIRTLRTDVKKGGLRQGKKVTHHGQVSTSNIVKGTRSRKRRQEIAQPETSISGESDESDDQTKAMVRPANNNPKKRKGKGKKIAKVGDLVSASPTIFDDETGSFSKMYPERCFGAVESIDAKGIAKVRWVEDSSVNTCKLRDLTVEKRKFNVDEIVMLLVEGNKLTFVPKHEEAWPKDFFEILVRSDWRKWVEAVKSEIQGWHDNDAVEIVMFKDVPASARVVPLGELYTIKRDGRYKFRQYLMGNLLRPGLDFEDSYSTTISSTGITVFYSLSTTSQKLIHGWDAICGYLQTKEQFDIYAYLPTHEGYSSLEYEDLGEMRKTFLKIFEEQGMEGIKRFARNHKKQYRANPERVYKCKASIYGNLSAGAEFEKLMTSVHVQTVGMTQTSPEPSMYVKIKVDENDIITGYVIAIAFVDDVRFFGTDEEVKEYKRLVSSKLKVKFEDPPISDFVSIETHQNLDYGITELKMPRYWDKAANFFKDFVKSGFKDRFNPLSVSDETILDTPATEDEIKEAKHLPFLQAVGILSYPASNCKFEIRYAISIIGSRRVGWSAKQFGIAVKLFEYCLTTKEMGLMYSNGLDPHGKNILYSYGDANLRLPRPQGCRIGMMNSAAVSMTSKKHTRTSPATSSAELKTAFDTSTDMLGLRNLLSELGNPQIKPTILYQDNTAAIQISNNRGSLGKASRAMDLETLTIRNRIEDHQIATQYCATLNMIADIGTKALPEALFVKLRDMMNGYAIVKAKYPELPLPVYVYTLDENKVQMSFAMVVEMINQQPYNMSDEEQDFDLQDYYDASDDIEEEEVDGDFDATDHDQQDDVEEVVVDEINESSSELNQQNSDILEEQLVSRSPKLKESSKTYMSNCDEYTFDELPDPRLYKIDESDIISDILEQKLSACDQTNPMLPVSYSYYMNKYELPQIDRVRIQKQTILQNDPLMVLASNQIIGTLLPSTMDSRTGRIGMLSRLKVIQQFGKLYCDRLNLMTETMTLEEVSNNCEWDSLQRPRPKTSWIHYQRYLDYFRHRQTLLRINPEYVPEYVNPRPIGELIAWHHRRGTWIGLCPATGQYKRLHHIEGHNVPNGKEMFHECLDATLWFLYKLWPKMSITVYPIGYELLTSDIPEIQNHLKNMRHRNPTWGRSLLDNHDGGWGTNN